MRKNRAISSSDSLSELARAHRGGANRTASRRVFNVLERLEQLEPRNASNPCRRESTPGHVDRPEMIDPRDGTTDVKRANISA